MPIRASVAPSRGSGNADAKCCFFDEFEKSTAGVGFRSELFLQSTGVCG
jgi:hypothetical protein